MKELSHNQLVELAKKWIIRNTSCSVSFTEITAAGSCEIPDAIGFGAWGYSVVVECKISRSDFLFDSRKKCRNGNVGMGRYRFFLCPENLIARDELPEGWGLIYVDGKGKARGVFNPYRRSVGKMSGMIGGHEGFEQNIYAEHCFMYSILRRNRNLLNT